MGVFKKGNCWYIDYRLNYRRHRECVGPTTKREAEKALAKRKVQIKEGRFFDKKVRCDLTVEEMVQDYLKYSKDHKQSYKSDVKIGHRLCGHFGRRKARDIVPSDIETYKKKRLSDRSYRGGLIAKSTVNRELAMLKAMYNRLMKDRRIDDNPVKYVSMYNEDDRQRDRVLTEAEFELLVDTAAEELKPILEMAYYTAMRKGEILNLTWDKIDLAEKLIKLSGSDTKTGRKRIIPLDERLHSLLKNTVRHLHCRYVFNRNGRQIKSVREGFENAKRAASIRDFVFHDLRHTAITRWVKQGLPENVIMTISGHRTRKVFDRYVNLSADDIRGIFDQMHDTVSDQRQKVDTYVDTLVKGRSGKTPKTQ